MLKEKKNKWKAVAAKYFEYGGLGKHYAFICPVMFLAINVGNVCPSICQ